jgi:hypothetical protein
MLLRAGARASHRVLLRAEVRATQGAGLQQLLHLRSVLPLIRRMAV